MNTIQRAALCALTLAMLALPTASAPANPILNYLRDRVYDFTDLFRFRVSVPESNRSLGFHVKATSLAQVGLLHHDGQSVGMDRRVMGLWDETRSLYGASLLTWTDIWRERVDGNQFADPYAPWSAYGRRSIVRAERIHWDDGRRSPLALGMELHTAILPGFDFGIYPLELVDLVGGVFLLDIRRDDLSRVEAFYDDMTAYDDLEPLEIADHPTTATPVFDPLADVVLEELGSQVNTGTLYRRMAPEAEQVDIMSILEQSIRELPESESEAPANEAEETDVPETTAPENGDSTETTGETEAQDNAEETTEQAPATESAPTPDPAVTQPDPTPAP